MADEPKPGSVEWLDAKIADFRKQQDQAKEQFATLGGAIQAYELLKAAQAEPQQETADQPAG